MSGGSGANNSWTLLTPEETVAETLRPLAEGTEQHEEKLTSAADSGAAASAESSPTEKHLVSGLKPEELIDPNAEQHTAVPADVTDAPDVTDGAAAAPASSDASSGSRDELNQTEGLTEVPAQSSPDPDSFSDSYTHITPSPEEPPASLLSTETLGGLEFTQDEEDGEKLQEGGLHPQEETTDLGKQSDSPVDSEVGEERTEEEGEPEVRRRRSLLERISRTEEEEEAEEDFQLPQREEDSGFTVNKCILGAVILLGLGTIFFSGVFMDLDDENEYATRELKDSEVPGKQEWLHPEVPPPPVVDGDGAETIDKFDISELEAHVQAQKELLKQELKVAKGPAAEGAMELEVEKENSRLKTEMASLPVLQKENERMKRELESVPALQKELETLRATVTELKRSAAAQTVPAAPPSGQPEDDTTRKTPSDQKKEKTDHRKEKHDNGEIKKDKEKKREKTERKDAGKTEWKKEKKEQGKFDKEKDKTSKQMKHGDEMKDGKKEKWSRGDEGKMWKAREGKKEWVEKSERKDRKEEKEWKKTKSETVNEGKERRGKEWRGERDQGEKHRGEKEWKKGKDGKEKWEKKEWKEKGEKVEWRSKHVKDEGKERGGKGERKQWEEKDHKEKRGKDERKQWERKEDEWRNGKDERKRKDERERDGKERRGKDERKQNEWSGRNGKDEKEWKRKDERKHGERKEEEWKRGHKERKDNGERKKDKPVSHSHKDEQKHPGRHHRDGHDDHTWSEGKSPHSHRRPSLHQPEYWTQQRERLRRNPKPPQLCDSPQSCAQAEGLLPVQLHDFNAVLQTYLNKAEHAGVDAAKRDELRKLTVEFFKDAVFTHDLMSFQDFVEDVGDILEDMVEEGEEEETEEGSALEEEMEEFEREVMKKFSVPGGGEKEKEEERRKERGRG